MLTTLTSTVMGGGSSSAGFCGASGGAISRQREDSKRECHTDTMRT